MGSRWQRMGSVLTVAGLCATAFGAQARSFDYSYISGGYEFGQAVVSGSSSTIKSDGPILSGSWGVLPHFALLGAYQRLSFSNISYLSSGHTSVYSVGAEAHGRIQRRLDVLAAVEYLHEGVNFSYNFPTFGPIAIHATNNGYEAKGGVRWLATSSLEVDGTLGYRDWNCNCSNNPDTYVAGRVRYYLLRDVSVNGAYYVYNHGGHLFDVSASYYFGQ